MLLLPTLSATITRSLRDGTVVSGSMSHVELRARETQQAVRLDALVLSEDERRRAPKAIGIDTHYDTSLGRQTDTSDSKVESDDEYTNSADSRMTDDDDDADLRTAHVELPFPESDEGSVGSQSF